MHINSTPEALLLFFAAVSLLINANKHGQDKTIKVNFWTSAAFTLANLGLLYWAGLFR